MLRNIEDKKNFYAVDGFKNKLIDELERMDRLSDSNDHKKDSDILIYLILFLFSLFKKQ